MRRRELLGAVGAATALAGCMGGGESSGNNQGEDSEPEPTPEPTEAGTPSCDSAVIADEGTPTIRWEAEGDAGYDSRYVDYEVTNQVDFPIQVRIEVDFLDGDSGPYAVRDRDTVDLGVIPPGETVSGTAEGTGQEIDDWAQTFDVFCP